MWTLDVDELQRQCEIECKKHNWTIKPSNIRIAYKTFSHPHTTAEKLNLEKKSEILNALNDDELQAKFETPEYRLCELASMATLSERFKKVAIRAFEARFERGALIDFEQFPCSLWKIEELFIQFGESITALNLPFGHPFESVVLRLISKYCPNILKLACLISRNSGNELQHELRDFIPKLEKFTVSVLTSHMQFDKLFNSNVDYRLQSLTMTGLNIVLPQVKFQNLIEFEVEHFHISTDEQATDRFYQLNPHLMKLSLCYECYAWDIARIVKYTQNLKELKLKMRFEEFDQNGISEYFCQLKQLKVLHINELSGSVDASAYISCILQAVNSGGIRLENMTLKGASISEDVIDQICQLKSVTHLEIGQLTEQHSSRLAKELESLLHIEITGERMTFDGIRDLLLFGAHLSRAKIEIRIPKNGKLNVINEKVFDEIEAIRLDRNIALDVLYILIDRGLEKIPVFEVRFWF